MKMITKSIAFLASRANASDSLPRLLSFLEFAMRNELVQTTRFGLTGNLRKIQLPGQKSSRLIFPSHVFILPSHVHTCNPREKLHINGTALRCRQQMKPSTPLVLFISTDESSASHRHTLTCKMQSVRSSALSTKFGEEAVLRPVYSSQCSLLDVTLRTRDRGLIFWSESKAWNDLE